MTDEQQDHLNESPAGGQTQDRSSDRENAEAPEREQDGSGEVSELGMSGDGPEAISPGDAVSGAPDGEPSGAQEGAAGPNSIPDDETDENPHKGRESSTF